MYVTKDYNMLTLTQPAVTKIKDILAEENNPAVKLRVFVQGGGCSGMSYGFTLDEEKAEDDWDLDINGVHLLVDSASGNYLQGAEIDFKEGDMGSNFSISNPNAQTTCGCGSSFSPH
jgi:iron-sulfur cluster insertion protein